MTDAGDWKDRLIPVDIPDDVLYFVVSSWPEREGSIGPESVEIWPAESRETLEATWRQSDQEAEAAGDSPCYQREIFRGFVCPRLALDVWFRLAKHVKTEDLDDEINRELIERGWECTPGCAHES